LPGGPRRFSLASVMGPARVMELLFCQLWDQPADFVVAQVPAAPTPARGRSPGGAHRAVAVAPGQHRGHQLGADSNVAATSNPNRPPTAPPRPIRRHMPGDMRNVQQGPQCGDQRLGRPGPPPADLHQQKPGHVRLPKAPANRSATGLPALTSARRTQLCTVCAVPMPSFSATDSIAAQFDPCSDRDLRHHLHRPIPQLGRVTALKCLP